MFLRDDLENLLMPAKTKNTQKYYVHPSIRMVQSVVAGMKQKTGRSLEEWLELASKKGPAGEKERREWLKTEFGLGTNYAMWITAQSLGREAAGTNSQEYLQHAQDYVKAMYAGPKEHLKSIYDEILKYALTMGPDIRVSPCKTIVPIYRKNVIANITPTARARIDLGLALGNAKVPKRLINTGGFEKKDRITHRIEIAKVEDFDAEAKRWLKAAYDANT
jgi:hypothetical protein